MVERARIFCGGRTGATSFRAAPPQATDTWARPPHVATPATARRWLLLAQRHHWIHARRPDRRQITRDESNAREREEHQRERDRPFAGLPGM